MELENKIIRDYLIYKTYDFQSFKTIRSFGREIYNNHISLDDALEQQIRLKDNADIFRKTAKPKESVKKERKGLTLKNAIILLTRRQKVLNAFESRIFIRGKQGKGIKSISDRVANLSDRKVSDHNQLKVLTPKQMLQRLPIALAQVKAGNVLENLLNEIRQIIYYSYREIQITNEVYNNIMNSIKL